jgi:hypothetical protein
MLSFLPVVKEKQMLEVRGRIIRYVTAASLCSLFVGCNQSDGGRTVSESKLSSVLVKWEKEGGDLAEMLRELGDYPIKDRTDAQAVCHALACPRVAQPDARATSSPLFTLAALFQDAASEEAVIEFGKNGLPHLRRWVRERMGKAKDRETNDLLFTLKVLAGYGCTEDVDLIVEAAHMPLEPESYMWPLIFEQVDDKHPAWRRLCDGLRDPLPESFLAVAYLDFANGHAIHGALDNHPFATRAGVAKLRMWLSDPNTDNSSYARSAATALPFVPEAPRNELLELAGAHPDITVRMEAAWAGAKVGDLRGRQQLQDWCRDVKFSRTASQYLEELGYQDEIPAECREPDFQAAAEMCGWLAHPQEYERPPDKIELYDKRILFWPPTNDRRAVWLFKYTYLPVKEGEELEIGIGMVGSYTFALWGEVTPDMSPEDVYGIHCCWELETNEDRRAPAERTAAAGRRILSKQNKGFK